MLLVWCLWVVRVLVEWVADMSIPRSPALCFVCVSWVSRDRHICHPFNQNTHDPSIPDQKHLNLTLQHRLNLINLICLYQQAVIHAASCQFTSITHLTFIPSYNSFASDTEKTNCGNQTWCIITVNMITKWSDQCTHCSYRNCIVMDLDQWNYYNYRYYIYIKLHTVYK